MPRKVIILDFKVEMEGFNIFYAGRNVPSQKLKCDLWLGQKSKCIVRGMLFIV